MSNIALILAAGTGSRMNVELPKQLLLIDDRTVLEHTITAFENHPSIDAIYIVTSKELMDEMPKGFAKLKGVILGGATRQQSSYIGLTEISRVYSDDDIVLIHDAARPLVSEEIITNNIKMAKEKGACATAVPATDTIYFTDANNCISEIPYRNQIFHAQTPQSFKLSLILNAHKNSQSNFATDDASLLYNQKIPVAIVRGEKTNIKLTTVDDLELIKFRKRK